MALPNDFLVYEIRMADGSFRFIVTNDKKLVVKNLYRDEKIIGTSGLESILGGNVQFIIGDGK